MMRTTLTVNGASVTADVEPRLQLADFLREHCLLTGTHIGCEHGVCGACTILLDDAPARSCIAYAAACDGADVRTIEGLENDPVTQRLRAAFTAEHALQCGYCTPGVLVTARDIVLRLPDADEARIRLELAGNLCRCTGYAGIVRAIARVLKANTSLPLAALGGNADERWKKGATATSRVSVPPPDLGPPRHPNSHGDGERSPPAVPYPAGGPAVPLWPPLVFAPSSPPDDLPPGSSLSLAITMNRPRAETWSAVGDPALLASCVPGARLLRAEGDQIEGEVHVALGPIAAVFSGTGRLTLDAASHRATLSGAGRDRRSGTLLSGAATVALEAVDDGTTRMLIALTYALRGPLAPLARPQVVQALAAGIADTVARNLERRLAGEAPFAVPPRLSLGALLLRMVRNWLQRPLPRS